MFFKFFSQILFFPNFFSENVFTENVFDFVVQKSFLTKIFFTVAEINLTLGVLVSFCLLDPLITPPPPRLLDFQKIHPLLLRPCLLGNEEQVDVSNKSDTFSPIDNQLLHPPKYNELETGLFGQKKYTSSLMIVQNSNANHLKVFFHLFRLTDQTITQAIE